MIGEYDMREKDVTMMGIKEVSTMIKNKEISPVEIIEECVKRTKKITTGIECLHYIFRR